MIEQRDPRIDPQQGDKVKAAGKIRHVLHRRGNDIQYELVTESGARIGGMSMLCWIVSWWKWCQEHKAQVLQRGPQT